jgi:hypothetical protein
MARVTSDVLPNGPLTGHLMARPQTARRLILSAKLAQPILNFRYSFFLPGWHPIHRLPTPALLPHLRKVPKLACIVRRLVSEFCHGGGEVFWPLGRVPLGTVSSARVLQGLRKRGACLLLAGRAPRIFRTREAPAHRVRALV